MNAGHRSNVYLDKLQEELSQLSEISLSKSSIWRALLSFSLYNGDKDE
jgi:hypothetical protein